MSSVSSYAAFFEHLAGGGLVVLPSARAARTLRDAFDRRQRDLAHSGLGPAAWEPAHALSWQQFTTGLFNDLVLAGDETRLLLNEAQEHLLWRETILATQPDALSSTDSLAELARSAWHLAAAWNATTRIASTAHTQDTRTFAAWAAAFTARCSKSECLSLSQLDSALLAHLHAKTLTLPVHLHLTAFDNPTPSQTALLEALRAYGTQIIHHTVEYPDSAEPLRASIVAPTERDELLLAARWIRSYLTQHRDENKSVAVVLPSLDDDRAQLDLIFREVLAPELESIHADLSSTPWEFATGVPLASLPLLRPILELAYWIHAPLSLDRISALLLSPFLGTASDRNLAAQFDAAILRCSTLLRPELDLDAFIALATTNSRVAPLPAWLHSFYRFVTNTRSLDKPRSFAAWAEYIRSLAAAAGWPGERSLTAAEFEATRAWDSVLDLLSTLDFAGQPVPLSTFLESLDRQARATTFSGPSTHAPVQVMSLEDAAGSIFDAVLFLRATDANWPRSPRPNPLLSWHLQQDLGMPGSSATASAELARSVTAHLLARSGNTLFFSAAENSDGHLRPSSLVSELNIPSIAPGDLVPPRLPAEPVLADAFVDAAPLPAPSSNPRGGSRILKQQAACGFLAFAELRLQSSELSPRAPGFDALESGNFLHKVLQRFWEKTVSQKNLRNYSPADRHSLLTECIDAAFAAQQPLPGWDAAYLDLQKQRLRDLLDRWLELELVRSPFTVTATEQKAEIEVGPLTLNIRVDRIDRIDPSSALDAFVFVDYKTSSAASPRNWDSLRPDDPQLPLYALTTAPGELQALAFAKIRAGQKAEWLGYQSTPGLLPIKTVSDLPQRVDAWRDVLTQLANAFFSGDASVSPKDFAQNCKRCTQRLVCRLNLEELRQQTALSGDDDDTDGALDD